MVCPRFRRVQDDRAVHPALAGVVLGDVGDRNLFGPVRSNSPLHQILRDQLRPTSTPPGPAGHGLDRGPVHQHLHLADEIGQPRVTDLPRRRATAAELVVTRLRDVQDPGGHLHRQPFAGHHRDRFEPPFAAPPSPAAHWPGDGSPARSPAWRPAVSPRSARPSPCSSSVPAPVDPVLALPHLDRLRADPEITRPVHDRAARRQQFQNLPPELRWIPTPAHAALPDGSSAQDSTNPTPEKTGHGSPITLCEYLPAGVRRLRRVPRHDGRWR
jgi:hypothetical protein